MMIDPEIDDNTTIRSALTRVSRATVRMSRQAFPRHVETIISPFARLKKGRRVENDRFFNDATVEIASRSSID